MPYLRTNQYAELAHALRMAREQAELVASDVYRWKWVIVALHNAVQAAIVCAISRSAGLGALRPKIRDRWLDTYYSGGSDFPVEKLDDFLALYERMKTECEFPADKQVDDDFTRLNRLRNDFVHFVPRGWTVEVSGLPRICRNGLSVIDHVAWDPQRVAWYDSDPEAAKADTERLREILSDLEAAYLSHPDESGRAD